MIGDFVSDRRGNIAMITAITLIPLLGILGGGLDIVRATTASSQLAATVDSAVLAAANLNNNTDVESIVSDYVHSNLQRSTVDPNSVVVSVKSEVSLNSRTVTVSATSTVDTYFLKLFRIDTLPVVAEATANQSVNDVEIALVLDISSSMRGNRLTNLKSASNGFIDQIFSASNASSTSMSIVPFGGTVNIGQSLFDKFAVPLASATVDPTEAQYDIGESVRTGDFRFTDGDYCLEHPTADFNDDMIPDESRGQVPHFWKWNNFNPWCPLASSAMLVNSNDTTALKAHIDGMTLSDGTGMDIGAMWGHKVLSPTWMDEFGGDFAGRPAAYSAENLKVMVVMTDGGITAQFRPEDYTYLNTHTNRPTNNVADGAGKGNSGNNQNQQTVQKNGGTNTAPTVNQSVGYFKRVCDDAKADGTIIYTIGFQIKAGSKPDAMLQYCASDPSKYYHVESLDIASAFNAIAASVNRLRITE